MTTTLGARRVIGEDRCIYEAFYLYNKRSNGKQDAIIKKAALMISSSGVWGSASGGQLGRHGGSPCNSEILCSKSGSVDMELGHSGGGW